MTTLNSLLSKLDQKYSQLAYAGLELEWYYLPDPMGDALHVPLDPSVMQLVPAGQFGPFSKNQANWCYTEFAFPETHHNIPLAGQQARIFVNGGSPFTFYLDGEEQFRETHAWHATGPISEPLILEIKPGVRHRLVLCLEPTEYSAGNQVLAVNLQPVPCHDQGLELTTIAAELQLAEALASTPQERDLVQQAEATVDRDALDSEDWPRFNDSVRRAEALLEPFRARAKAMTVHLVGHTHIDMDWMWTWTDTRHCIRRDAHGTLELMDQVPELRFTISQVPFYDTVRQDDPEDFQRIVARIKEGRWECVAGTWVEGDLHMADGESVARHMLYAKDWTRAHLGVEAKTLWEPDTFGHPGNMPQLARLGELDTYFHWRCNPGRDDNWPVRWWEGVDGTRILTFSQAYGSSVTPDGWRGNVVQYARRGWQNVLHVYGLGDHGGGLPRWQFALAQRLQERPLVPPQRFSTVQEFRAAFMAEQPDLPSNRGETFSLFEGCFTTHASIKRYNRICEGRLLVAETMAALAGLDRCAPLREAWTGVLFNHFHDIMDGAAVHDSYLNAHQRAEFALETASRVTTEALQLLVPPEEEGATLTVVNPLGFARTEPVRAALPAGAGLIDEDGVAVPVQPLDHEAVFVARNIPAFGSRQFRIVHAPEPLPPASSSGSVSPRIDAFQPIETSEDDTEIRIETRHAVILLNKQSGVIGSYFDRTLDRELVGYGVPKTLSHVPVTRQDMALNVFTVLDEAPNLMSAWLINDILREEHLLRGARVTLVETGPVFARVRVHHQFRQSRVDEDLFFYQDCARVDGELQIDWREQGNAEAGVPQLKLGFGTTLAAPRARFEGPFCITERPADGLDQPSQKWTDVTGQEFGLTLYNDSKYGFDVLGSRLRMTLLRNPYAPDPEPDNGRHVVRFGFEAHEPGRSTAEMTRRGMAFNRPLLTTPGSGALRSLEIKGDDGIVVTSLRRAEHEDALVVRLFEATGHPGQVTISLADLHQAREINFLERPVGEPLSVEAGTVSVGLQPWEVKSLLLTLGMPSSSLA